MVSSVVWQQSKGVNMACFIVVGGSCLVLVIFVSATWKSVKH